MFIRSYKQKHDNRVSPHVHSKYECQLYMKIISKDQRQWIFNYIRNKKAYKHKDKFLSLPSMLSPQDMNKKISKSQSPS